MPSDSLLRPSPSGSILDDLNSQLKDYHVKKIDELTAEVQTLKKENRSLME